MPRAQLDRLVARRLRGVLEHASCDVPYFRRRLSEEGVQAAAIKTTSDLSMWPILTRADIVTAGESMISDSARGRRLSESRTSGTSGVPIRTWRDRQDRADVAARNRYVHRTHGWTQRARVAMVRGIMKPNRVDAGNRMENGWKPAIRRVLNNTRRLQTYGANEPTMQDFLRRLAARPPDFLTGRPTDLEALARCAASAGTEIRIPNVQSFGEILFEHQRALLHQVFGAEVFDRYGTRETGSIAM